MSKYIKYFETLEDSEGITIEAPFSGYVNNFNVGIFSLKNGIITNGRVCEPRIYYTSSDNNVITPYKTNVFGASIISNTYDNLGVLDFDGLVTSIGNDAFYYCSKLTTISIPNSVTSIGSYAFYNCSFASITIPDSVTSIGNAAFADCSSLTSITIGNSVTTIEKNAFLYCTSLTSVTIGASVTSIGDKAFYNCKSLTSITCEATTPPTLGSSNNLANVTAVYVPAESVDLYKNATNWSYYSGVIKPIE